MGVNVCAGHMRVCLSICVCTYDYKSVCVSLCEIPWVSFLWHSGFGEPLPACTSTPTHTPPQRQMGTDTLWHLVQASRGQAWCEEFTAPSPAPPPFLPPMKCW